MIPRYTREEIGSVWSDENKFRTWMEVEIAVLRAREEAGLIPEGVTRAVRDSARFSVDRIKRIEDEVHHDVIAFITNVGENIGEYARYFHQGMTSSDVLDTALALQIKQVSNIIARGLDRLSEVLANRAMQYKYLPCIGRTHGVHAEPITFGLKLAGFYAEVQRDIIRFNRVAAECSFGKLSGAVGTYSSLKPEIEVRTMEILNLEPEPISTQIIQRDRLANYITTIALIGGTLERIALEIRHLSRTEVREAEEPFAEKQRGSSAMPHKKNPIISENICGLSRVLRANAMAALENQALWHERDISHSSVERIILPDSTILLDFMLFRLANVIEELQVYPENMKNNLKISGGLIFSQNVLNLLLDTGMTRDQAYTLVQRCAMKARDEKRHFKEVLMEDGDISSRIDKFKIEECFKISLQHIDAIFERLGL